MKQTGLYHSKRWYVVVEGNSRILYATYRKETTQEAESIHRKDTTRSFKRLKAYKEIYFLQYQKTCLIITRTLRNPRSVQQLITLP